MQEGLKKLCLLKDQSCLGLVWQIVFQIIQMEKAKFDSHGLLPVLIHLLDCGCNAIIAFHSRYNGQYPLCSI